MKIRTRIMIALSLVGAVGLLYLFNRVNQLARPVYLESIEDDLVEMATVLAAMVSLASSEGRLETQGLADLMGHALGRPMQARIYDRLKEKLDFRVYVTDLKGRVIYDSQGKAAGKDFISWNDVRRTLEGGYGARATWETQDDLRIMVLYVASPVVVGGEIMGSVTVGKPTPVAYSFFQKVRREAFFAVSMAALLGTLWILMITVWVTRPIRALTQYAEAVRDGRHAEPPRLGKSDIATLGEAFEEMRDALEGKRYVEQYVHTLTHEIKSPLSAIKGASELLDGDMPAERRARFIANISMESERIQRIVDRLLELSSLESRKTLQNLEKVAVAEVVGEILESVQPLIQAKEIHLNFRTGKIFTILGERFLLRLAFSNLIQNAVEFTPRGGRIEVIAKNREVVIRDSGPGVPEYALDRVFERFYSLQRPDGDKSSGLGLSIVKRVAELHNATALLNNMEDRGAEAVFRFPPKKKTRRLSSNLKKDP